MRPRVPAFISILRPHNMLASALAVWAGYRAARGAEPNGIVSAALLTALVTGAGNVLNDYFDLRVDRINKPNRPLPSGRMTPRAALACYLAIVLVATAGALTLVPRNVAFLVIAWQIALALYARWCKRWLLAGNLLVASISCSAFFAGAMVAGHSGAAWIPAAIAFSFVMCREIVKGAEDLEGDRTGGVRTLAVVIGPARAGTVAALCMLVLAALLALPALAANYRTGYLYLMELFVAPVLLAGSMRVAGSAERRDFAFTSRALKLGMFVGIVAIAIGA